jgi:hypothetical protein
MSLLHTLLLLNFGFQSNAFSARLLLPHSISADVHAGLDVIMLQRPAALQRPELGEKQGIMQKLASQPLPAYSAAECCAKVLAHWLSFAWLRGQQATTMAAATVAISAELAAGITTIGIRHCPSSTGRFCWLALRPSPEFPFPITISRPAGSG